MQLLKIAATRTTPSVLLDPENSVYRISGNSLPENAGEFYAPVVTWCRSNLASLSKAAIFEFDLPYFNSSSLKALYLLLTEIKQALDAGKEIVVNWHVEEHDEFMLEAAETFEEMVGIQLNITAGPIKG